MEKIFVIFLHVSLYYCKGCSINEGDTEWTMEWNKLFNLRKLSLMNRNNIRLNIYNDADLMDMINYSAGPFNISNFQGNLNWTHKYQGDDWLKINPQCGGNKQSPINIDKTMTVNALYPAMKFEKYQNFHPNISMINNGHLVSIRGPWGEDGTDVPTMSGGPLNGKYKLFGVHCHWGYDPSAGSEHTIDGCAGALEMHFVHYNTEYENLTQAILADDPESLAVVGFIFKAAHYTTPEAVPYFETLIQAVEGDAIYPPLVPLSLLKKRGQYYTYTGSLTTPNCAERVRWIVRTEILYVSYDTLDTLRMFQSNGQSIEGNYRSLQPLNNRTVFIASVY